MTVGDLRRALERFPDATPVYTLQEEDNEVWRTAEAVLLSELLARKDRGPVVAPHDAAAFHAGSKADGVVIF